MLTEVNERVGPVLFKSDREHTQVEDTCDSPDDKGWNPCSASGQ